MEAPYVNIHTHRPTGRGTELRSAGIHPWDAGKTAAADAPSLGLLLAQQLSAAQAIGETGLDAACGVDMQAQERLFRAHLELAGQLRLPVVIHCVRRFEAVMSILGRYRLPGVIFHGFIGSRQQALQAAGRGYMLSFGRRSLASPRTAEAMRALPPESMFLETDDDDTAIEDIYAAAADAVQTDIATLRERIYGNYKRLFTDGQLD